MGIEYYAFAFYVFILICIILLLCKVLFSKVKKQKILFDEKEEKLLKLYQTVEDAMDEFFDMTAVSKAEIDEALKKMSSLAGTIYKNANHQEAAQSRKEPEHKMPEESSAASDSNKVVVQAPEFQKTLVQTAQAPYEDLKNDSPIAGSIPVSARNEAILRLFRCGKTRAQIAQDLNITQNEVDLVIGMSKNSI